MSRLRASLVPPWATRFRTKTREPRSALEVSATHFFLLGIFAASAVEGTSTVSARARTTKVVASTRRGMEICLSRGEPAPRRPVCPTYPDTDEAHGTRFSPMSQVPAATRTLQVLRFLAAQ